MASIFIGIIASFNLFTNNGFSFHDETQIVNLFEYDKIIGQAQFPPRWSPDTHFTYGSPYPEFNYQIPYYLGVIFHRTGFTFLDSYKLVLASTLILGSLGIYLLGVTLASPIVGLAASFLYTFTPYRAVDVYARGTIGEAMALGLFPWVILALHKLKLKQNINTILFLATVISALILSHQPSTAFGLPIIIGIFAVSEVIKKNINFFKGLFISLGVTVTFTAYYLIPLLLEQKFIKPVSPFNFYDHFPFIKQLIFSPWGYGVSIMGPYDGMSFQVGFANLAVLLICLLFSLIVIFKRKTLKHSHLIITLLATGLVFFLMNIRSSFLWYIFPYTDSIQFPWRLLALIAVLTSYLYLLLLSISSKWQKLLLIVIPLIALINNYSYFRPGTIIDHDDNYYLRRYLPNQVLKEGETVSVEYLDYTEEYLPLPFNASRSGSVPLSVITASQYDTQIEILENKPFSTAAKVTTDRGDMITVHKFYYPGWVVSVDGMIQEIYLNKIGAISLFIDKGEHSISIVFRDTPVRFISNLISFIAISSSILTLTYYSTRKHGRTRKA